MSCSPKNNNGGFTIVELVVGLALTLIILGVVISVFNVQSKSYCLQEQLTEMQQNVRAAMDMMVREIKMAGYDPAGNGFNGIVYDTTQLQILADLDGNGTATGTNENITYRYYNTSDYPFQIKRKTGSGSFQPFAENIQTFTFDYLNINGTTTTSSANIRQVRVAITGRTAKLDPDYNTNGGYRTYNLTTVVTPQNLGY